MHACTAVRPRCSFSSHRRTRPLLCGGLMLRAYAAALLLLLGCKKVSPPPLPVRVTGIEIADDIDWSAVGISGAAPLDAEQIAAAARDGLRRAGVRVELQPSSATPGDFRLRMEIRVAHVPPSADTDGRGLLRVFTAGQLATRAHSPLSELREGEAEPRGPELYRLEQTAVAEKIYRGAPPDAAVWAAQTLRALGDAAHALGVQLQLLGADTAALLRALTQQPVDPPVQSAAIKLLALRKERAAVPALIALLKAESPAVRDQAIGALVEIGDQRAVKPLLHSTAFQDTYEMGKIMEAAAALGGDEARDYLNFVRQSHPEQRIRAEAETALRHLEQRAQRHDAGAS